MDALSTGQLVSIGAVSLFVALKLVATFGGTPKGAAREARHPFGVCCLPFGKDSLCFRCISGAETGTETGFFTKTLKPGMKPETEAGIPE